MKKLVVLLLAVMLVACHAPAAEPPAPAPAQIEADLVALAGRLRAAADGHAARADEADARATRLDAELLAAGKANGELAAERDRLAARATAATARLDGLRKSLAAERRIAAERAASAARHRAAGAAPVTVKLGQSIANARAAARAGDTVRVAPGVHGQGANVPAGVTLVLYGATLDGQGKPPAITLASGAAIVGGTISNWASGNERGKAAVRATGDNAVLDGVTIERVAGAGFGSDSVAAPKLIGCTIRDTGGSSYLFGGNEAKDCIGAVLLDNAFDRYNTGRNNVPSGPGVNKATRTDGLLFAHNAVRDGFGPGVWLDVLNTRFTLYANAFSGLQGSRTGWEGLGVYIEICNGDGSLIAANAFRDLSGAAISLAESGGMIVTGNTLDAESIEFRDIRDGGDVNKQRGSYSIVDGQRKFVRAGLKDIVLFDNVLLNGAKDNRVSGEPRSPGQWDGDPAAYLARHNVVWID
jgi:hypothetical protein